MLNDFPLDRHRRAFGRVLASVRFIEGRMPPAPPPIGVRVRPVVPPVAVLAAGRMVIPRKVIIFLVLDAIDPALQVIVVVVDIDVVIRIAIDRAVEIDQAIGADAAGIAAQLRYGFLLFGRSPKMPGVTGCAVNPTHNLPQGFIRAGLRSRPRENRHPVVPFALLGVGVLRRGQLRTHRDRSGSLAALRRGRQVI